MDVRLDASQGLEPGLYTYRLSAIMAATDANNPDGETLAGDFFPVQVQPVSNGKLQLVLSWNQVPGAKSYRIYRSPLANSDASQELMLAEVADSGTQTQFYVDKGATVPSGAMPLQLGSTGVWKPVAMLNTARAGAAVAVAPDSAIPNTYYLYAMGGNSGTPSAVNLLQSVEYMTITVTGGGAGQTTTAFTTAINQLPSKRWLTAGLSSTNVQNSNVTPGTAVIYSATGLSGTLAAGTLDAPNYVALVGPDGAPGAFTNANFVPTQGTARSGIGATLLNNQFMAFGGFMSGAPVLQSESAVLAKPGTSLDQFTSFGSGQLKVAARALQGTAVESAFIYQLGGAGIAGTLTSTEQTIW